MDNAKSISSGEPTLLWVAVELLAAGFDLAAAAAAFKVAAGAVKSIQAGTELSGALRAIEGSSGGASGKIVNRVLAEAEAAGALERAIVAEGKQYAAADLARMRELIEQSLGRTWAEEFEALRANKRVVPFTREGLEGVLGKRTAERFLTHPGAEGTLGMYHLDSGKAFVRPAAEGDLANAMVHEMSHAIQGWADSKYAPFIREFEAYAAQRQAMQRLNRTYGWQPKNSAWLLNASDWEVAKHIRLEYGHAVPPWVLESPTEAKQLDKAFAMLTKRLERVPSGP